MVILTGYIEIAGVAGKVWLKAYLLAAIRSRIPNLGCCQINSYDRHAKSCRQMQCAGVIADQCRQLAEHGSEFLKGTFSAVIEIRNRRVGVLGKFFRQRQFLLCSEQNGNKFFFLPNQCRQFGKMFGIPLADRVACSQLKTDKAFCVRKRFGKFC